MEPYKFQSIASTCIADRFNEYMQDPLLVTRNQIVPFFQNLSAITGAGKTLILADAISQMRLRLPAEPIVLWLSKGKVVVSQTYSNLSIGKYSDNLPNFKVLPLLDCNTSFIEDESTAILLVATVGKFNQKDMDKGDRLVFKTNFDSADISLWDTIKFRTMSSGNRRPLIIVYDEGHNLSDQQTELLLKLEPDAIVSASATMRIPEYLNRKVIQRIKDDKEWETKDFITAVKSSDVVAKGLIKKHVSLGGYVTPMEEAVNELITDYNRIAGYNIENNIPFRPKAIYVSNTNIVAETGEKDNIMIPFEDRMSRPIKIWRYLVNNQNIDPDDIAIYCDLKFDPKFPAPPNFHLFSGGDNDYDDFVSSDFHHIIFNLSLQEGWDDPSCCFAYIDKEMGSKDQVTQIVGRVLRQPNSQHYPNQELNTAHLYVRTDDKNVFDDVINEIRDKLSVDTPEVTLSIYKSKDSNRNNVRMIPRKNMKLPLTNIDASNALEPIRKVVDRIPDFTNDTDNTVGKGSRIKLLQNIGSSVKNMPVWVDSDHTNRITARWLFKRELQKYFPKVANLCDTENKIFDALVEFYSKAADIIKEKAVDVVDAYVDNALIVQDSNNTFSVPEIYINPGNERSFKYSVHEKYSDFNNFELDFAKEIDKYKKTWFRNPKQGCFEIPLLDKGGTNNFNPDFIIWDKRKIFAIDTKGDHLIAGDAPRKLFSVQKYGNGPDLEIRLVAQGEWNTEIRKIDKKGYTVWKLKNGKVSPQHVLSISECVSVCLN